MAIKRGMVKRKRIRARNREGQYLADDKKTPDRNEAYKESLSVLESYKDTVGKNWSIW